MKPEDRFAAEVLEIFLIEAKEHSENLEILLFKLEKNKDSTALIDQIFRIVHSLKGGAAAAGVKAVETITHEMENVLSLVRELNFKIDERFLELLFEEGDLVTSILQNGGSGDGIDVGPHLAKIREYAKKFSGQAPSSPGQPQEAVKAVAKSESEYPFSNYDLESYIDGFFFYRVTISKLDAQKSNQDLPGLLERINNFSLPIQVLVDGIALAQNNQGFEREFELLDVLVSSKFEFNELLSYLALEARQVRVVEPQLVLSHSNGGMMLGEFSAPKGQVAPHKVGERGQHDPSQDPTANQAKTVRIRVEILDQLMRLASELVLVRNQQLRILDRSNDEVRATAQKLDAITTEMQGQIMATRMQPIGNIFVKFPRIVRDLSKKLNKSIELVTMGEDVELDKTILEALADPLLHLVRNCCDHGIEDVRTRLSRKKPAKGCISIRAFHEGGLINIEIKDDGGGIALEALKRSALAKNLKSADELAAMSEKDVLQLIFIPGFSTASQVTDVSGRGVGMDVVKTSVEKLGGAIDIKTSPAKGTEFHLRLPLTLAIIPCLIVKCFGSVFAIPQVNLDELIGLLEHEAETKIEWTGNREVYRIRNQLLPLVRLSEILTRSQPFSELTYVEIAEKFASEPDASVPTNRHSLRDKIFYFAVLKAGPKRFGLVVDEIVGTEEVVISPMHSALKELHIYSGSTVRGDGKVSLILDAFGISEFARIALEEHFDVREAPYKKHQLEASEHKEESLLLFRAGDKEQYAIRQKDIRRVMKIAKDKIQTVGNHTFASIEQSSINVLYLNQILGMGHGEFTEEAFLILPKKQTSFPLGILATYLVDIGAYNIDENKQQFGMKGVEGSTMIDGKVTLLLDVDMLVKRWEEAHVA